MTCILGVDPGFGRCGFAVIEKQKTNLQLETFGTIQTSPKSNFPDRVAEIGTDFQSLLEKYRPEMVSIEALFFGQNVSTAIRVAEVRGVILYLSQIFGAQICEPKPVELKLAFTGNGRASKSEIKKMAQIRFRLPESPKLDDSADAIGAAVFGAERFDLFAKK